MSFMSTVHEVEFSLEILNLIHFQSKCYSNLENKYLLHEYNFIIIIRLLDDSHTYHAFISILGIIKG